MCQSQATKSLISRSPACSMAWVTSSQRVEPSAELDAKLAAAQPGDAHFALAEAGIWYDALDTLSLQIEAAPKNENLRAQRAALFDQVGLENLK